MTHQEIDEEELWERVTGKKKPTRHDEPLFELARTLIERLAYVPKPKSRLEKRVEFLENEVRKLKGIIEPKIQITKADKIYEKFRKELESKYHGKIVAIDIESETVTGIGDSILEAYEKAKLKSPKSKFSYKRVGYPYVFKL